MTRAFLAAVLAVALTAPALADEYPVSGRWGQSTSSDTGPIDCSGRRVIAFNGNQRTDSKGGVPAYRNRTVTAESPTSFRVVDGFTTGQISDAYTTYTLRLVDDDRIEMLLQQGGTITLQRCK